MSLPVENKAGPSVTEKIPKLITPPLGAIVRGDPNNSGNV